jgi:decaprenylphospho-beta-D-ribofuranose 2-oxidase
LAPSADNATKKSLRVGLPSRVLEGFGRSLRAASRYAAPRDAGELAALLRAAAAENLPVTFRGNGRSYGDASLNAEGVVLDLTGMNRMLAWDPVAGVAEAEPGMTIEGLWRRTIEDGFWPPVVPGTMFPTLGGCLAMNIHGKNNYYAGTFGEHVLDFDLLTVAGELLPCSREENPDLFHAVIGGAGLLGVVSRLRLRLKKVESGLLRVTPLAARSLVGMMDAIEERRGSADYLVGWVDCWYGGRGQIHAAGYVPAAEDPTGGASLHVERQGLPPRILGLPRDQMWRLMRPFSGDLGTRAVNSAKYAASRLQTKSYLQPLVAFSFLLDYIPGWWRVYGPGGLIQVQSFVPDGAARTLLPEILRLCRERGIVSSLGVLKRHRPDPFLLTHGLDGWSLALDFRVTPDRRDPLWKLGREIADRVLAAGGSFYLAKDAILRPADLELAYKGRLAEFRGIKRRLDPGNLLMSDQGRRLLG